MKKTLLLSHRYLQNHGDTANKVVSDLNMVLDGKVKFTITKGKLEILVYEEKVKTKAGRPVMHSFDYESVKRMQAEGKTNKEIYTVLGISKALFYLRMREYKNNILDIDT